MLLGTFIVRYSSEEYVWVLFEKFLSITKIIALTKLSQLASLELLIYMRLRNSFVDSPACKSSPFILRKMRPAVPGGFCEEFFLEFYGLEI